MKDINVSTSRKESVTKIPELRSVIESVRSGAVRVVAPSAVSFYTTARFGSLKEDPGPFGQCCHTSV